MEGADACSMKDAYALTDLVGHDPLSTGEVRVQADPSAQPLAHAHPCAWVKRPACVPHVQEGGVGHL